jgi:predicted branched-subunit amino acid permease
MSEYPEPRNPFWEGVRSTAPVQLGSFPFGLIVGVTAVASGLDLWYGQGMSLIMFAGASQIVAMQLLREGAPALIVIASACIVNLRFLMYSATLAPHYRTFPLPWKLALSFMMTDQGFAVIMNRFGPAWTSRAKMRFALGSCLVMWTCWQVSTLIGILMGSGLPESWSLDFAVPMVFLALVVPGLRDRPAVAAFVVAGVVSVTTHTLPLNLGLLVAAVAGIITGMLLEARGA